MTGFVSIDSVLSMKIQLWEKLPEKNQLWKNQLWTKFPKHHDVPPGEGGHSKAPLDP